MICEIINPSDKYTLVTDDFVAAAVAIALVGRGQLGLRSLDGEQQTPVLFGWDDWLTSHCGADLNAYVAAHRAAMADALASVLMGGQAERGLLEAALAVLPEADREPWKMKIHDQNRSSVNDIGRACWAAAKRLRTQVAA